MRSNGDSFSLSLSLGSERFSAVEEEKENEEISIRKWERKSIRNIERREKERKRGAFSSIRKHTIRFASVKLRAISAPLGQSQFFLYFLFRVVSSFFSFSSDHALHGSGPAMWANASSFFSFFFFFFFPEGFWGTFGNWSFFREVEDGISEVILKIEL